MPRDFLVEIGTEELPPTSLRRLSVSFTESIHKGLEQHDLAYQDVVGLLATPRRLAVIVRNLSEETPAREVVTWGPPTQAAFDQNGRPTKAAEGFAKKNGVRVDQLDTAHDGKADKLVLKHTQPGKAAAELLPDIVDKALADLPIPRRMRWGTSRMTFVRPVHWVVMLLGNEVVDGSILGCKASNTTRGHRFHCDTVLEIANPSAYETLLEDSGHVIPSFEKRRDMIREQVIAEGTKLGGTAVIDDDLLDEVTALVEWPVALTGSFDERFLSVPAEALIASMAEHQKYFHTVDANGRLLPHFITVSNIASTDPARVIAGNERVIRPRLADARFFYETDCRTPLTRRRDALRDVVFQEKLGSLFDKTERIATLAETIAETIGADSALARQAGELSKCDLVSEMVLEFDNMQGIAGAYYARHDGLPDAVATALEEQYLPRHAGDALPATPEGCAVALADRLDTLVGIFGIGQPPSGSRDPFGLRRAALGVIRIIIERQLSGLSLSALVRQATGELASVLPDIGEEAGQAVLAFIQERYRAFYQEQGFDTRAIAACQAVATDNPRDFDRRLRAVAAFQQRPESHALASANKRVANILRKTDTDTLPDVDKSRLQDAEEKSLFEKLVQAQKSIDRLEKEQDYEGILHELASMEEEIAAFFEAVMVMAEDPTLRTNRLALLSRLRDLFLNVADISLLAHE